MKPFCLAFLLLSACGVPYDCRTSQGLKVIGTWQCDLVEQDVRLALEVDLEGLNYVEDLNHYTLTLVDSPWIHDDRLVAGLTGCFQGFIEADRHTWRKTLAHELFHVREDCRGDHTRWNERGIYSAILSIDSILDKRGTPALLTHTN